MRAEQFIKDHGLERARKELNKLPNFRVTHMTDDARMFVDVYDHLLDEFQRNQIKNLISIEELKRLVESVDLINSLKEIPKNVEKEKAVLEWCSKWFDQADVDCKRLNQAIADYESIYGEGNE